MNRTKMLAVVVAVVSCAACLQSENRHAFYLEPNGAATWAVMEEDVRSGAEDRGERQREEAEYLATARRGETEIAIALRFLGGTSVQSIVVRDRAPFTVWTEARFASSARMLESFLTAIGFEAETDLWFEGGRTRLSFRFRESESNAGDVGGDDGPAGSLVESVEQYRFVLTEGEFTESTGFRLERGGAVAVMLDPDEEESAFYSLTW